MFDGQAYRYTSGEISYAELVDIYFSQLLFIDWFWCQSCLTKRPCYQVQGERCIYCGDFVEVLRLKIELVLLPPKAKRSLFTPRAIEPFEIIPDKDKELVYFIQDTKTKLIKIGYSGDILQRRYILQLGLRKRKKGDAILLGYMEGTKKGEKAIHKMFHRFRDLDNDNPNHTEWFHPKEPVFSFIKWFCKVPTIIKLE